ncbi:uncharacterized protein AB675_8725 [Cyphellophora attinorum]|uniref:Glycine zipper 2TM domain-containing protein n=1 Tax=Cyphellophora attinorum TaxID=1664694 RepID=A0A0N1HFV3_9EURO|nr:uncharacterized protein AB675_8725 [Phialophora attinorum]KPI44233.1 hypothetical protein AB675_8725 [Phialophora attinorum]
MSYYNQNYQQNAGYTDQYGQYQSYQQQYQQPTYNYNQGYGQDYSQSTGSNNQYYNQNNGVQTQQGERGLLGAVGGGAAGAYGGHKVNHGFLGAIGGAISGHLAEEYAKKKRGNHKHKAQHHNAHGQKNSMSTLGGGSVGSAMSSIFSSKNDKMILSSARATVVFELDGDAWKVYPTDPPIRQMSLSE